MTQDTRSDQFLMTDWVSPLLTPEDADRLMAWPLGVQLPGS